MQSKVCYGENMFIQLTKAHKLINPYSGYN